MTLPKPSTKEDLKDWFFRKSPPHSLALFRIIFGISLIYAWVPRAAESHIELTVAVILVLLLFTSGLWMRPCAGIGTVFYSYLSLSLNYNTTLLEPLAALIFLVLAFSGADKTFSLAMRVKYGSALEYEYASIFPQRLMTVVLTAAYTVIGLQRLWTPMWGSGTSLWSYAIGDRTRKAASWIARQRLPIKTFDWATYVAKAFGLMLPPCLWIKSVRAWFFLGGIVMHIASGLFFGTWWTVAAASLYVLFIEPEDMQAALTAKKNKS